MTVTNSGTAVDSSRVCETSQCFLILLISSVLSYFHLRDTPTHNVVHSGGFLSFLSGAQEMMVLVFEVNSVWQ